MNHDKVTNVGGLWLAVIILITCIFLENYRNNTIMPPFTNNMIHAIRVMKKHFYRGNEEALLSGITPRRR